MEDKLDLRVKKTYKYLFKALQDLLCEKSFDEITVTELCERAEIRKATFYKHFSDKSDLFIFMVQSLQENYEDIHAKEYNDGNEKAFYSGIISYLLDYLEEHEKMVLEIISSKSRWQLLDLLSTQVEYDFKYHLNKDYKKGLFKLSPNYLASIFTGALVEAACYWITHKNEFSKQEAVSQFSNLVTRIYNPAE
ncbi:MAG: TetR/AcrR family transcriptional regulator [Erysipelotrichaceae bacterium]